MFIQLPSGQGLRQSPGGSHCWLDASCGVYEERFSQRLSIPVTQGEISTMQRYCSQSQASLASGFTLAELAIVLLIVGLLLAGILTPLSTQIDVQRTAQTQKSLDEIKEALVGFAVSHGNLPCPDKVGGGGAGLPNDGQEDVDAGGNCVAQEGNLPWNTLGLPGVDAWGNYFHYRITPVFAARSPAVPFSLSSAGNMTICPNQACTPSAIVTNIPAVALSYGKNGYGASSSAGGSNPPVPVGNVDESENTNQNTTFVSRAKTNIDTPAGEFDDIVVWLSSNVLFNRMVAAGRLP